MVLLSMALSYFGRCQLCRLPWGQYLSSTLCIPVTLFIQNHVRSKAVIALQQQNLGSDNVLIAPTPLSLLWRVVSMDGDSYHEGFTSLLDNSPKVQFDTYESGRAMIDAHTDHWPVARLDWFTDEMISANRLNDELVINDLRMGIESTYIFRFKVGRWNPSEFEPLESVELPIVFDFERMRTLLRRTWDEQVVLKP